MAGKAQQAYTAMSPELATNYVEVKAAILRRYDINAETYRRRFRTAKKKEGEAYLELATRLIDLLKKWMSDCTTVEEIKEKIVTEQLLNTMPRDLRIWVGERKPKTGEEAGRLADDYLQARQLEVGETAGGATLKYSEGSDTENEGSGKETRINCRDKQVV